MSTISRPIIIAACAAASAGGSYMAHFSMDYNGFGDAMWKNVVNPPHKGYPGAPSPVPGSPTGIKAIDTLLLILTGFFSGMLDGDVAPQYRLYAVWGMAQFGACWLFIVLEGLRAGNKGKAVGWVTTASTIIQIASHMFMAPLWLILHVLTSPIARLGVDPSVNKSTLRIDPWHLAVLPFSFLLTYFALLAPAYLPPNLVSTSWHYFFIQVWQPFPIWYYIVQTLLVTSAKSLSKQRPAPSTTQYLSSLKGVYNFITAFAAVFHLPVIALALAPSSIRGIVSTYAPVLAPFVSDQVSLRSVFAPWSPFNPPAISATTLASGKLAPLGVYFLHYDMYLGNGAILLWALYLHRNAVWKSSAVGVVFRAAGWFLVGGHAAAIASVLWERDLAVETEGNKVSKKRQ